MTTNEDGLVRERQPWRARGSSAKQNNNRQRRRRRTLEEVRHTRPPEEEFRWGGAQAEWQCHRAAAGAVPTVSEGDVRKSSNLGQTKEKRKGRKKTRHHGGEAKCRRDRASATSRPRYASKEIAQWKDVRGREGLGEGKWLGCGNGEAAVAWRTVADDFFSSRLFSPAPWAGRAACVGRSSTMDSAASRSTHAGKGRPGKEERGKNSGGHKVKETRKKRKNRQE